MRQKAKMTGHEKILVIQTAFPGDIVLTTPLFRNLKEKYPAGRLTVLTTPQGCELLKDSKWIDSLVSYDKKGKDRGLAAYAGLIRRLRKERFDLCISPHRSFRTAVTVWASGAKKSIGFSDASLSLLYNNRVKRDMTLHEVERVLSLLKPLGVNVDSIDRSPDLDVAPATAERVETALENVGISPDDTIVGVAPGSVWPTKRWTEEGYAALIDRLVDEEGAKVLLLGSPADREIGERIISACRNKPVNMIGATRLGELAAFIDRCRLLIGNDSAPGHVAAARGVPVISIFGPTVTSFGYSPYGANVAIVEKDMPCRPCHHHGPAKCPEGHFRCMKNITADDVMDEVRELLKDKEF